MRKLAQAQKLDWLKDFDILNSGTSQLRTVALVNGNAQGALLTQPYDVYAERQGMHVLARGSDVIHDWISNGLAVNPTWAASHRPELVRFLGVLRESIVYAYAHPPDAVAIMSRKLLDLAGRADLAQRDLRRPERYEPRLGAQREGTAERRRRRDRHGHAARPAAALRTRRPIVRP